MNLNNFTKGWLVGDFSPSILKLKDIEIGIKKYKQGDVESRHVHKMSDEYTIVLSGVVSMNNIIYKENDIVHIEKCVSTDFLCLEDSITLVIKTPSITNDKEFL